MTVWAKVIQVQKTGNVEGMLYTIHDFLFEINFATFSNLLPFHDLNVSCS